MMPNVSQSNKLYNQQKTMQIFLKDYFEQEKQKFENQTKQFPQMVNSGMSFEEVLYISKKL